MTPREYAVEEIRALGRRLTSGSWHRNAPELTVAQALAVIGEAVVTVVDDGARAVFAEGARRIRELAAKVDE